MFDQIKAEFQQNSGRVENLISAYRALEDNSIGDDQTRKDVLRAAVVLMHSTMEEVIRNLYRWLLPNGTQANLNKIPFVSHEPGGRPKGVMLGELLPFKGRFVSNVIVESIDRYVDTMNLNSTTQLVIALEMVSIDAATLKFSFPQLDLMMKRRHQIVHQMDRDNKFDPLEYPVSDISLDLVVDWEKALHLFFSSLLLLLPCESTGSGIDAEVDAFIGGM